MTCTSLTLPSRLATIRFAILTIRRVISNRERIGIYQFPTYAGIQSAIVYQVFQWRIDCESRENLLAVSKESPIYLRIGFPGFLRGGYRRGNQDHLLNFLDVHNSKSLHALSGSRRIVGTGRTDRRLREWQRPSRRIGRSVGGSIRSHDRRLVRRTKALSMAQPRISTSNSPKYRRSRSYATQKSWRGPRSPMG